ncbi:helix-turn-helix domain-containing protein [Natrinema soli]|uniref:Helix-turn-helix domain-containing protein n=1 Tax=Natrinema soli TaxID=1930624 RepID=A0ABD5SF01_9EURY|nr:helix-turn-helix domain-containing protein [Natrinema soli]
MSTIIEINIPGDGFALGETMREFKGVEFKIERIVAQNGHVLPYVWANEINSDSLETAFDNDSSVTSFESIADLGSERLYRMNWNDQVHTFIQRLVNDHVMVLALTSVNEQWHFRLLVTNRDALTTPLEFRQATDVPVTITGVYELNENYKGRFGFTEKQQKALLHSYERGYYEIPRNISVRELSSELGISHQAYSERLRRGHMNLIRHAFVVNSDTGAETGRGKEL